MSLNLWPYREVKPLAENQKFYIISDIDNTSDIGHSHQTNTV